MAAIGAKRTLGWSKRMTALGDKADIGEGGSRAAIFVWGGSHALYTEGARVDRRNGKVLPPELRICHPKPVPI